MSSGTDKKTERVAVAMSGGVDSSVAAGMLRDSGMDVFGLGLELYEAGQQVYPPSCGAGSSMDDAEAAARTLGIPFEVLDFTSLFKEKVVDYFVATYLAGETPNPCVACNKTIKFGELLDVARERGARYLATGHYVRLAFDAERSRYIMRKGADPLKDQSYFLYSLSQEQLEHSIFPLGDLTKSRTRELARNVGLELEEKPESQDVCFMGSDGYASFILDRVGAVESGPILDESGFIIGKHRGLPFYTIGQRRGLGVSFPEPVYVVDIDRSANTITVASASCLKREQRLFLRDMNYVSVEQPQRPLEVQAKTRYRKPQVDATLIATAEAMAIVEFDSPQEPTAPGQSVVLYDEDIVVGGGIVTREGRG